MADEIKEGDIVQLKSGGPHMTVQEVDDKSNEAFCRWFDSTNTLKDAEFPTHMLKKPEPKGSVW